MSLHYVIDGYNIINNPLYARTDKHAGNPCRGLESFISSRRLSGSRNNKVTFVFDGYPSPDFRGPEGNFGFVFSRKISADDKIKRIIEDSGERKNIIVVSDDRELKSIAKLLGAGVCDVAEFIKAKEERKAANLRESIKPELNYTQIHQINQELKKIWLKE